MPYRTVNQNTLAKGMWNVLCDRCGFKMKNVDVRREWNGLYTCKDCWEPRHPSDYFRGIPDDPSVAFTRPDTDDPALEYNGDVGKTLIKGTNQAIQDWNTELTDSRVVILSSTNAINGDQFIIYKTVDSDDSLIIVSTQRDIGVTV